MKKLLSIVLLLSVFGCNSQSQKISVDEFEKGISNKDKVILLDVRTHEEFAERHIDGATNINFNDNNFDSEIEKLDKSKTIYVYCLSGGRSAKSAETLTKSGFKNVYDLQGGILAWANAGKPIVETAGEKGISMDNYLASVTKDKLVLVDFNATWCGPCKKLKPILHKVAEKQAKKLDLLEIDVDENSTLADKMHIDGIPLLILYKNGKEVWRNMGLIDESDLEKVIAENT